MTDQKQSKIHNEPTCKMGLIVQVREQLEHRALWMYLLCDEAKKAGAKPEEFAPKAVKRCGLYQGDLLVKKGNTQSLLGLKKTLFGWGAKKVFDMKIVESTDDTLSIDFSYCPLVKAWQKQGCSDEEIAQMCDWAMCGDAGIGEAYGCILETPKKIAYGDDHCEIRYKRAK